MSINRVHAACKIVMKTTDEEIAALRSLGQEQAAYLHPLKQATQARLNRVGQFNLRCLALFEALRAELLKGPGS